MEGDRKDRPTRLLLVEDNPADEALFRIALDGQWRFEVTSEASLNAAVDRVVAQPFDAILLDMNLPDSSGTATVRTMVAAAGDVPVLVLTGMDDDQVGAAAVHCGAQDYVTKDGLDGRQIARAVRYAIERKRLASALVRANESLDRRVRERTAELERSVTMLGEQISERRDAEQDLRQSQERFHLLLDALPDVFWIYSLANDRVVFCNRAFERVFGRSRDALLADPRAWQEPIHPDDRPGVLERVAQTLAAARAGQVSPVALSYRIVQADGRVLRLRERVFPLLGPDHETLYLAGVAEPLTGDG